MSFVILVPESVALDVEMPGEVRVARYDPSKPIPEALRGAEALVVWGNPPALLREAAQTMPKLNWVQTLAAGAEPLFQAEFAPQVLLTTGRGLHDETVTEHALALTLAVLRRVPEMVVAKQQQRWAGELGGRRVLHDFAAVRTLIDARVLLWGFGSIARKLAPVLKALGAQVTGVATKTGEREGFQVISASEVKSVLPETAVLIALLPDTKQTRRVLNADVFAMLPKRAVVVNVGRGSALDEAALDTALRSGTIAGAALDVFATEPLPESSPLWTAPNLLISPHAAGGRPIGAGALIAENARALLEGAALKNVVSPGAGPHAE